MWDKARNFVVEMEAWALYWLLTLLRKIDFFNDKYLYDNPFYKKPKNTANNKKRIAELKVTPSFEQLLTNQ